MVKGFRWVWPILNIVGIIVAVLGMLGVIGLISFDQPLIVFVAGTIMILMSAAMVLYEAQKLGLFKEPDNEIKENCPNDVTHREHSEDE